MTKKTTRRALVVSILSLVLCFTMLVGTTFAWFTDSVKSGKNKIVAGNLDVELEYAKFNNGKFDKWVSVEGAEDIFDPNALWEPGHTEVAYLKVSNLGTLALKYQLNVNVYGEVAGINVDDEVFYLSDYLVFKVVEIDEKTVGTYTRDTAMAAAGTQMGLKAYNGETKNLEKTGDADYVALIIYMPTTVDNKANYKTGTTAPSIEMGVELYATQMVSEDDSFGKDYDENAAFSVWNGVVPTEMPASLVVDGTNQIVHVKDAAAFAYLSTLSANWAELYTDGNGRTHTNYAKGAGTNYYYSGQWTVSLEADIDLNNKALAPVNIVFGESTGATAFDGNYHTIRNINATTGLFADGTHASFSNLTLENVKATNGSLAGIVNHPVTDVTVKNANISGVDYVGGLVGKTYSSVTRCKVIDSSVVATGKEAGGLIGYAETNSKGSTILHNTVKNLTVFAGNRAAGLIAQPNSGVVVRNNTVDTVTVAANDLTKYAPGAIASNALAPENVYDNTVKDANVIEKASAHVTDPATLSEAVKNYDVVLVGEGAYKFPASSIKAGSTIICDEGTVFEGNSKLNIKGATVVGATFANPTGTAADQTINGIFKDCVFDGSNGLRWCYAGETVVFENCVFTGDVYGVHFDGGANDVTFKGCTFSGFNALGGEITQVTMEDCTFVSNGRSGYNGINLWGSTDMKNCKFVFDGSVNYEWVDVRGDNKTCNFEGCIISDGMTERALTDSDVGDSGTGNTITVK